VRLLVLGERHAPIVLALPGAPAAAASPAPARVLIGRLRLSAAIAAPLSRGWLRGGAGPPRRLRPDGRWPETRGVGVQLLVNELYDDAADKLVTGPRSSFLKSASSGFPAGAATIGVYDASVRGFPSCQSGHGFGLMLRCEECGREARTGEEARGWRTFLIVVKEGQPAEAVDYCPDCAKREFEDDR
jgi:hypothetical protein